MPLFLVRHGETRFSGTYCGSTNPPLTRRGRRQVASAARRLAGFPIDVCYASPLLRAQETASIVTRRRAVPLIAHPFLKELHFGAWEGLRFEDIERQWPRLAARWVQTPTRVRIPKGETFASLRQRIKRFLDLIRNELSHRHVLIVAHGGSLSAIALELLGLPDKEFANHIQPAGSVRMIQGQRIRSVC